MADDNQNPLSGTEELSADALRSELEHTEYTVDELEDYFEAQGDDYTPEQLRVFRSAETARSTPRTTATEAINRQLDAATRGPEQPTTRTEGGASQSSRGAGGGDDDGPSRASPRTGVTHTGYVRLENVETPEGEADLTDDDVEVGSLPSPYHAAAPETVRVNIPRAMMFAGRFFEDPGVVELPYREPNGDSLQGMRVKRSLEDETTPVRLDKSDPMHPNYDTVTAEEPVGEEV